MTPVRQLSTTSAPRHTSKTFVRENVQLKRTRVTAFNKTNSVSSHARSFLLNLKDEVQDSYFTRKPQTADCKRKKSCSTLKMHRENSASINSVKPSQTDRSEDKTLALVPKSVIHLGEKEAKSCSPKRYASVDPHSQQLRKHAEVVNQSF